MYIPTDEYLDEIKARREAATPEPWEWEYSEVADGHVINMASRLEEQGRGHWSPPHLIEYRHGCFPDEDEYEEAEANAKFIAHARTDVPLLELGCRNLKGQVAALERDLAAAQKALDAADKVVTEIAKISYAFIPGSVSLFVRGTKQTTPFEPTVFCDYKQIIDAELLDNAKAARALIAAARRKGEA